MTPLAKIVEALLFLSPEPVSLEDLRDATEQDEWAVLDALTELRDGLHGRGVVLQGDRRRLDARLAPRGGGGRAAAALAARARRRSRRRRPRRCRWSPTCSRSRGRRWRASAASPRSPRPRALAERGLIEEAGRSPFGAVLYRTTPLFLKLFGLRSLEELPELEQWDPSPGGPGGAARPPAARGRRARRHAPAPSSGLVAAASCPQAASMSRPRVSRTVARRPCSSSAALNASIAPRDEPS